MNVIIIGSLFSLPEGDAATNRVLSYARGFIANGAQCTVICMSNEYGKSLANDLGGIAYYYPFDSLKRSGSFLKRNVRKITKYARAAKLILDLHRTNRIDAFILYSEFLSIAFFTYVLSKIIGATLVLEESEDIYRFVRDKPFLLLFAKLKVRLISFMLDGVICINSMVADFFMGLGFEVASLIVVPGTVDFMRFDLPAQHKYNYEYIGYFGRLNKDVEAIDCLIRAFAQIHADYKNIHLLLSGKASNEHMQEYKELVSNLHIGSYVHFIGYIDREELPALMLEAKLLIDVRRQNLRSVMSFPSKIAEYLCAGKPMVVTNVGEVNCLLIDNVHCYLANPDDDYDLTIKIQYVLENYKHALEVASHGREFAKIAFDNILQTKKIMCYLDHLRIICSNV